MSLIQKGIQTALDSPVIDILAKNLGADNLVSLLREHFTFTAFEIAQTYQTSYGYDLAAISAGLAKDDQKNRFIQTLTHSKLSREFFEQINTDYLQPFAAQHGLDKDTLGEDLLKQIKPLSDLPPIFQAPDRPFTETELAALVHEQGTLAISDLVLTELQKQPSLDDTLAAFFRYQELLGNAILFFFREIIRKDQRAKITLETLQTAGLWADVRDIKTAQATLTTTLQQQLEAQKTAVKQAIDAGDFGAANKITQSLPRLQQTLDDIPQHLQAAQTAWQTSQQHLIDFSQRFNTWAKLLDEKVEQVLTAMNAFHTTIIKIDENVETLLQEVRQLMQPPEKRPEIDAVIARLSSLLETLKLKSGDDFRDPLKEGGFGPEMIIIPAGKFRMGDIQDTGGDDEKPVHEVSVKSFAMGRYPLTVGEFRQFVDATGYKTEEEKEEYTSNWRNPSFPQQDDQPVVCISWNHAMAYIDWLTQQTGQAYGLPSEAQWEYAARAGTDTDYWWGNEIGQNRAVCDNCGSQWDDKQTAPVGSFKPNPFGLYDTAGNVWEWCADGWHENYEGAPTDGSVWEGDGSLFVLRGGSGDDDAMWMRSSGRLRWHRSIRNWIFGVRLARIL
ncbi:MAG: formylglycine-generating enzyme family protein [Candidatus Parabeggiatoa sp.]|nr:formylglycine-generating enzyme family protein [Candidatus Parabeggiatoa sp.]